MFSEIISKLPELPKGFSYSISEVPDTLPKNMPAHVLENNFDASLPDFLAEGPGLAGYLKSREELKEALLQNWDKSNPAQGILAKVLPADGDGDDIVDLARTVLALRAAEHFPEELEAVIEGAEKRFKDALEKTAPDIPSSSYEADFMLASGIKRDAIEGRNDRTRNYLIENGLMNPENGLLAGASEMAEFGRSVKNLAQSENWETDEIKDFVVLGERARNALAGFFKASEATRGGLTVIADLLKEDCAREFGAEMPAACGRVGNSWVIVHKNELKNGDDAGKMLKDAEDILKSAGQKSWLVVTDAHGRKMREFGLIPADGDITEISAKIRTAFPKKSQKLAQKK